MVYVDPKNLGYKPFWDKWTNNRQSKTEYEWLNQLYEKYVPNLVEYIIEGIQDGKQGNRLKTIVPLTNLNLVSLKNSFITHPFELMMINFRLGDSTGQHVGCTSSKRDHRV